MRIAIIDDHALVRSGLAGVVVRDLGATVVHEGADPEAILGLVPLPDVLLLDLDLGGTVADPELAGRIQAAGCRVLVVSALADGRSVTAMLDAGVSGFVSKREPPATLVEAITEVMADGTWTSPEVAALVLTGPRRPALSEVQERVLTLYAAGMKLDSVARVMGISPGTAATHLKRARAKYTLVGRDTSSRVDLYREALRDGLIRE
ncbi:MAG TPA: response regulator transcription factor [Candidatus Limnocylindrales bacterium]|nr:response regulator transcription factor [Candidatus Limnocylindrales bacterium]